LIDGRTVGKVREDIDQRGFDGKEKHRVSGFHNGVDQLRGEIERWLATGHNI
jgi:hypothetical protein